jgi:hypothetical protein
MASSMRFDLDGLQDNQVAELTIGRDIYHIRRPVNATKIPVDPDWKGAERAHILFCFTKTVRRFTWLHRLATSR